MTSRHLIDLNDLTLEEWDKLIALAKQIKADPDAYFGACRGKILATLFYEPSTRTQMSFQTAMLRLGGRIIGFDNPSTTSVAKGESLKDTIKVVSGYADIVAMRHYSEGSVKAASLYSEAPIINAGDGGHLHPTQTLTDLVTLSLEKGRLTDLTIGICGDLKNGRTVHSLIKAMCCYKGNKFVLISTPALKIPAYIKDLMNASGCAYKEVLSLDAAIPKLDVLYMTRIQRERFASQEEYESQKDIYVLDADKLSKAKRDLKILHPLPRVDEITVEVDDDPRAIYFAQAKYGVYARMALILMMLSDQNHRPARQPHQIAHTRCSNPRCITATERYLPNRFEENGDMLICDYCDHRMLI